MRAGRGGSRRILAAIVLASLTAACEAPEIVLPEVGSPSKTKASYAGRGGVLQVPPAALVPVVEREARRAGLEPHAVFGVIAQESAFNAKAVSSAGALGLMQLMPATIDELNNGGAGISDPFNPEQNIAGGVRYLRWLYNELADVNPKYRWAYTLAAYNGGLGRVRRALAKSGGAQAPFGKVAPLLPEETQGYVPAVLRHQARYQQLVKLATVKAKPAKGRSKA